MAQGGTEDTEQALAQEMLLQSLRARFEAECAALGEDPNVRLLETALGSDLWDAAGEGLRSGSLALVFAADPRASGMDAVADFLNTRMHPDGVGRGAGASGPSSLDPLAEAAQKIRAWDERSFFQELNARRGHDEAAIADAILAWARDRGLAIRWDGDEARGSFTPWLSVRDERYSIVTLWTDGSLEPHVADLRGAPLFAPEPVATRLEQIATPLAANLATLLEEPAAFEGFLSATDWIVDTILAAR
jgi:hypothetical protein